MYIAKAADGSLRDGLSLLDQCVAFHYGKLLTYENALEVLGAVDSSVFSRMFNAVADGRTRDCITELEEIVIQGRELGQFVTDFIWYLRNLLLVQNADDPEGQTEIPLCAIYGYFQICPASCAMPARNVFCWKWL